MKQLTIAFLKIEDGSVYYEAEGEGTPLVFLNAAFVDSGTWDSQCAEFRQHNAVIRFDMRGCGKSDRLKDPISRRQELYSVLETKGVKRAALDVTLDSPELVSALVIISLVPGGFEMQDEPPENLIDMMAALEQGDLARASEFQMRLSIDAPFRQPDQVAPMVRQRAGEMNREALAKVTFGLMLAPAPSPLDPPAVQSLDQIRVPTLIIAGELDNRELLRAAAVMAAAIPNVRKVIMPNAAHLPNMEQPAEFNRAVKDFLHNFEA
jgi:pimeloyl-ACP methyl ester carboxylesterase